MDKAASPFIEGLVEDEIRRFVMEVRVDGGTVATAECVAKVMQIYPTCGLSFRTLSDRVIEAAKAAGVPVEVGSPASEADSN